jgi:hypothetical protein
VDVFSEGRWLDDREIPLLNEADNENGINRTEAGEMFQTLLISRVVNWAWTEKSVYLVSYPMSEDDCKKPHNNRSGS